jgi:hypothetical protein
MSEEYVLENPTTSTDVWGRLERAEARVKELEFNLHRARWAVAWLFKRLPDNKLVPTDILKEHQAARAVEEEKK